MNAKDGSIVWHYDSLPHVNGTGNSLYSGRVTLDTLPGLNNFILQDVPRGLYVRDMNNQTSGAGTQFVDNDNVWGDSTLTNRQTVAVDAQFGAAMSVDYFAYVHGRNVGKMTSYVQYGSNYTDAHGVNNTLTFGGGDGSKFGPLVSLDLVGHEFTHSVTQYSAGLKYVGESGAINESFSDIFGTAIEFYADIREFNANINPNYLIGESFYTPGIAGDALRSMEDPPSMHFYDDLYLKTGKGDPDHYSKRYTGSSDNGGVHSNSGIMNKV